MKNFKCPQIPTNNLFRNINIERDVQGAHGDAGGDGEEDHSTGGGGAA